MKIGHTKNMDGIIIVLGSPNDEKGNLSDMAFGRLNQAISEYKGRKDYKIVCTGGFGKHFNTTDKPHAFYAVHHLIQQGIPEADILEMAESQNTLEDALLSKPIVDKYGAKSLIIVTSDFHIPRVRYIFERIFKGYDLNFSGAITKFSNKRNLALKKHERRELKKMKMKNHFADAVASVGKKNA